MVDAYFLTFALRQTSGPLERLFDMSLSSLTVLDTSVARKFIQQFRDYLNKIHFLCLPMGANISCVSLETL
jgi:hypothetical protein